MSGGGTSTSNNQNNAQNNLQFTNTGSINVGGSIGNGNTTQTTDTSSQGGSIGFSATVNITPPTSPTPPTAPSMPGMLMNLEDFVFDSVLTDNANVKFGEILTGDAGHVTIKGSDNDFT